MPIFSGQLIVTGIRLILTETDSHPLDEDRQMKVAKREADSSDCMLADSRPQSADSTEWQPIRVDNQRPVCTECGLRVRRVIRSQSRKTKQIPETVTWKSAERRESLPSLT